MSSTATADLPSKITYQTLQSHFASYPDTIPPSLSTLSIFRYTDLPTILADRKNSDSPAYVSKPEVTGLLEWKLKHGTYRPALPKLLASNTAEDVESTTKLAFDTYDANHDDWPQALTILTKLKGVGPATASLVLACYDPENVPFFSDELFRWVHFEDEEAGKGKGKRWERKIGYTIKEYRSLFAKTLAMRKMMEKSSGEKVMAVEIEKVAYAIYHGGLKEGKDGVEKQAALVEEKDGEGGGKQKRKRRKHEEGGEEPVAKEPVAKRRKSSRKKKG